MASSNSAFTLLRGFSDLLIIVGLFISCTFLGYGISLLGLMWYYGLSQDGVEMLVSVSALRLHPDGHGILLFLQAIPAMCGFWGGAWLYLRFFNRPSAIQLNPTPRILPIGLLLVVLITIVVIPFTSLIIEWNANLDFPAFLDEFESWAKKLEKELEGLTLFITDFQGIGQLLMGLFVIALIPAVGEELLFRGLIQNKLAQFFNIHAAIWLAGMIFSAVHFQFYGFIPRMLLGVLFGYIYYWSGNLWLPILGHFVNNAFTLTMFYLFKHKLVNVDLNTNQSMPIPLVLLSLGLTIGLLFYFRKIYQSQKNEASA
jgi:hypothetical protein